MMIGPGQLYSFGFVFRFKVWRIKIIFPSYADKREQRIAPGVGERCPHPLRRDYIGDRAHRPFRGDPFTRRMSKYGGKAKKPGIFVDCGGLDCRDLMAT
jgi:hypothetical protein